MTKTTTSPSFSPEQPTDSTRGLSVHTGLRAGKPLGDFVEDITHYTGLVKLAEMYTKLTGRDCGCRRRQEWLNEKVPHFFD